MILRLQLELKHQAQVRPIISGLESWLSRFGAVTLAGWDIEDSDPSDEELGPAIPGQLEIHDA